MSSLAEFAAKTGCVVCSLDQVDEINDAIRQGVKAPVIFRWLAEDQGVTVDARLRASFDRHRRHTPRLP